MIRKGQAALIVIIIILMIVVGVFVVIQFTEIAVSGLTGGVIGIKESAVVIRNYDLKGFEKIKVRGKGDLFLTQGDKFSVKIEAQEDVLNLLEVAVVGDSLDIGRESNLIFSRGPINIRVTMPEVKRIDVSGSSNIKSNGKISGENLVLSVSGSGNIDMELNVVDLFTKFSGSGNAVYSGVAKKHDISITGNGNVRAFDLISDNVSISIAGSGDVDVFARKILDVNVAGNGNVRYIGDASVTQKVSGSGDVRFVG